MNIFARTHENEELSLVFQPIAMARSGKIEHFGISRGCLLGVFSQLVIDERTEDTRGEFPH